MADQMTGLRKAAVLLLQLGKENAAKVLGQMREAEVEALTAEIVRLDFVDGAVVEGIVDEFHHMVIAQRHAAQGGMDFARDMLIQSLGNERADEIVGRLSAVFRNQPFSFLQKADARQVLSFVQEEHPQTVALVLAHMNAAQASAVLSGLTPELQTDVANRIAVMDRTSPDAVLQVESVLERKLGAVMQPTEGSNVGGLQPLVDIINRSDRATERMILEGLAERNPELAELVRAQMFVFEDITSLDDRAVQLVLRQVESGDLAVALKGVREDVLTKVLKNMSERAAENLREEIELLGPQRLKTVEDAQAKIVQSIRALEESGQIVITRGDDEEMVA
jgi:flagellar motor switch protein FliG